MYHHDARVLLLLRVDKYRINIAQVFFIYILY